MKATKTKWKIYKENTTLLSNYVELDWVGFYY